MISAIVIIIIIILFIAGIIILRSDKPYKAKPRGDYLQQMAAMMEGQTHELEGSEGSFRVNYRFEGEPFVFEDMLITSFDGKINKAYLKLMTATQLTLTFSEKKKKTKVRGDIFMASDLEQTEANTKRQVKVPKQLQEFEISTDNIEATNVLFADSKFLKVFTDYKNQDKRGYPFMALKVVNGEIILEFSSMPGIAPSLNSLRKFVADIEDYSRQLLFLQKKINNTVTF